MPSLFVWILVFIVSLAVLVKSSDVFTDSASEIGLRFGLSPFIVGATIVAVGTSLPELSSSISAVLHGSSEIVLANVIGSNITNIFLILGIGTLLGHGIVIKYNLLAIELLVFLASAFLLSAMIWDGTFSFFDGTLALLVYGSYLFYTASTRHKKGKLEKKLESIVHQPATVWKPFLILIASSLLIFVGAKYTVVSVIAFATALKISTTVISITAVALGTSLPELAVTLSAVRKGNIDLVIGNILGSNVFNALAVTGISALFGNLVVQGSLLTFGIPMMIIASILFFAITQGKRISSWEGAFLLIFYAFFLFKSFGIA